MRWLVVAPGPSFSVFDVYTGWAEALRDLGQTVHTFNMDDRLTFFGSILKKTREPGVFEHALTAEQSYDMAADTLYSTLYKVWPDVLLVISGFFIPQELLDRARRTRTRVVIIHTESPYEDDRQVKLAPYADLNLLNDPSNIDRYPKGTQYVPHAYRPTIHHPGPPKPGLVSDFTFNGTAYPSRIGFFELMDLDGLDVVLTGNWSMLPEDSKLRKYVAHDIEDCLDNDDVRETYWSAKVGMNLYRREAERPELAAGWSMGPREIEMAACGLFFLRDPRPESNDVFPMLPSFTSPAEASELLRYWLDRPDERESLARKAREAIADRTFAHNAKQLLRLLDA